MYKLLIIVCCCIFIESCSSINSSQNRFSHVSNDSISTISVNLSETVPFDSVLNNFKCIKLETNDNCLFSSISKMRVYKDKIYLCDRRGTKFIFIYDTSGKHLKTINNQGRANNEFIAIENFEIDYINEKLVVNDDPGSKLLYYDLDGNFEYSVPVKWKLQDYAVLSNGRFLRARNSCSNILNSPDNTDLDHLLVFSDSLYAIDKICDLKFLISNYNYLISTPDGSALFLPTFSDTLYTITNDGYSPLYKIDIGDSHKMNIDQAAKFDDFMQMWSAEADNSKTFTTGGLAQTDRNVHLLLGFGCIKSLFYSKQSGNSAVIDETLFLGDIAGDENGMFWGSIDPILLSMSTSAYAKEILSHVSEGDNPVLICFDLKDF